MVNDQWRPRVNLTLNFKPKVAEVNHFVIKAMLKTSYHLNLKVLIGVWQLRDYSLQCCFLHLMIFIPLRFANAQWVGFQSTFYDILTINFKETPLLQTGCL